MQMVVSDSLSLLSEGTYDRTSSKKLLQQPNSNDLFLQEKAFHDLPFSCKQPNYSPVNICWMNASQLVIQEQRIHVLGFQWASQCTSSFVLDMSMPEEVSRSHLRPNGTLYQCWFKSRFTYWHSTNIILKAYVTNLLIVFHENAPSNPKYLWRLKSMKFKICAQFLSHKKQGNVSNSNGWLVSHWTPFEKNQVFKETRIILRHNLWAHFFAWNWIHWNW